MQSAHDAATGNVETYVPCILLCVMTWILQGAVHTLLASWDVENGGTCVLVQMNTACKGKCLT
jgi:hypothetical protein